MSQYLLHNIIIHKPLACSHTISIVDKKVNIGQLSMIISLIQYFCY